MRTEATRSLAGAYGRIRTEMNGDGWLYGTTTVKEFLNFREPVLQADDSVPEGDYVAGDEIKPYFMALDAKGELGWESGRFANKGRAEAHVLPGLSEKARGVLHSGRAKGAGLPNGHGEAVPAIPHPQAADLRRRGGLVLPPGRYGG